MEAMDCITTRRSVRKFSDKKIEHKDLEEIIKAAQYAPSAHNKQEWEFLVIEDKKFLEELPKYQQWTTFAKYASAAVIICGDKDKSFGSDDKSWDFVNINCSLAAQNLMLAAHAKGLGSTMCAVAPIPEVEEKINNLLNLPSHITAHSIIVLGYPEAAAKQPENRFKPEKIHWEKW